MISASIAPVLSQDDTKQRIKNYGRAKLADYFGDLVIYRNLEPLEKRLPGLKSAAYRMGLNGDKIPRKLDADYAKAALWFAEEAQKLRRVRTPLSELIFVGDTVGGDGQAYRNMLRASGWRGACFIGSDRLDQAPKVDLDETARLYHVNRWTALGDWVHWIRAQDLHLNDRTVLIMDIDKTALGAKGRNDLVIDKARLEGIYRTMDAVLGEDFDSAAFERQYSTLNRARYHVLTEDNQDYLAYICLVLNTGLIQFDELLTEVENQSLHDFEQVTRWVTSRMMSTPNVSEAFRQVHEAVSASLRMGDPTPFKRFRREEFASTIAYMGQMPDDSSVEALLANEITLTQEVCELAAWLKERGSLLLCLSDKPHEASCPSIHAAANLLPVHKTETHQVGTSIRDLLNKIR